MTQQSSSAELDLESITYESLDADPYTIYAQLRESAPVAHIPAFDEWFITRWDDCMTLSSMTDDVAPGRDLDDEFFGTPNILTMDGDVHRDLRVGIDALLRPRAVKKYIDDVARPVVVRYIERLRDRGEADLTTELFEQISVRVVGDQLGMTDVDDDTLIRWFHTLSQSHDIRDGAESGVLVEIEAYLRAKIAELRETPDDSIMSNMLHGGVPEGQPRTYDDVSATLRVIILGGFQEPGHAVANTFYGLFGRPDQLAELIAEPQRLAAAALNEGIRWMAPVTGVSRTARRDIDLNGTVIPAGARLSLMLSSANRDAERFENPDEFDMNRTLQPNASFGYGAHYCAGHFFARSLGQIIIEETVTRLPGLRPHPEKSAQVSGYGFRAANNLPAVWETQD